MTFFEQELRKIFPQTEARFAGRDCYIRIDENLRAKISFRTDGTHEHYEGIEAAIINRTHVELKIELCGSLSLTFSQLLGPQT